MGTNPELYNYYQKCAKINLPVIQNALAAQKKYFNRQILVQSIRKHIDWMLEEGLDHTALERVTEAAQSMKGEFQRTLPSLEDQQTMFLTELMQPFSGQARRQKGKEMLATMVREAGQGLQGKHCRKMISSQSDLSEIDPSLSVEDFEPTLFGLAFDSFTKGQSSALVSSDERSTDDPGYDMPYIDCELTFCLKHHVEFGQALYVSGSLPEFGEWKPCQALCLQWSEGDYWSGKVTVEVPINSKLEFKYVVANKASPQDARVYWEDSINNRSVRFGEELQIIIEGDKWDISDSGAITISRQEHQQAAEQLGKHLQRYYLSLDERTLLDLLPDMGQTIGLTTFMLEEFDDKLSAKGMALSSELIESSFMYVVGLVWKQSEEKQWESAIHLEKSLLEQSQQMYWMKFQEALEQSMIAEGHS